MIKFRAWDIKNKRWMTPEIENEEESEIRLNLWGSVLFRLPWYEQNEGSISTVYANDAFKIMQSTGLKDKYGVEIYESDIIVNHVGDVWVITYFRGAFRYYPIESYSKDKEKLFETDNIGNFGTEAFEVIGNIYEDIELMEVAE